MASVGTLVRTRSIHVVPDPLPDIAPAAHLVSTDSLLAELRAELRSARQIIANVRAHHRVVGIATGNPWCIHEGLSWPCETIRALDGTPTPDDAA